jgi:hypothetical protein
MTWRSRPPPILSIAFLLLHPTGVWVPRGGQVHDATDELAGQQARSSPSNALMSA